MPGRLQLDIGAPRCIEMSYCQISTFPSQPTVLAVSRSPNFAISDGLFVTHATLRAATVTGECLIVNDFNAPAVARSIAHALNLMGSPHTSSLLQRKNCSISLSSSPHASGWGAGRQCYCPTWSQ